MNTPNTALNIGIELLCSAVCVILALQILLREGHKKRSTDKWFLISLFSNIAMMFGDMANWAFHGIAGEGIRILLFFGTTVYFASSGMIMFSFYMYIHRFIGERKPLTQILPKITFALMSVQVLCSAISPFTGLIFTYDADNEYKRGFLFLISQAIPVVSYLITLVIFIYSRKSLNFKEKLYFTIYMLLISTSEMLQVMNYGMPLLNIALTLAFLLVSLFINSELDDRIGKMEKDIENERYTMMENMQGKLKELTGETILALSNAVEAKDRYTSGHSRRVAEYAAEIVRRMGWSDEQQKNVYFAGLLHDVGKIRVSDAIINKNGRLDDDEFDQMKLHTTSGYYILKEISSISDFAVGARYHHERYDGRGYPNRLAGEDIPIIARVIGVADAYDAMTSNRSYRAAMPQERVRGEIEKGAGVQFDPEVAKIMLEMIDEDTFYQMRQINAAEDKSIMIIDSGEELYSAVSDLNYKIYRASGVEEAAKMLRLYAVQLVVLNVEDSAEIRKDIAVIKDPRPANNAEHFDELAVVKYIDKIPLIAVTDGRTLLDKEESLGIADCVTKPFTKRAIAESVQNILFKNQ